MHEPTSKYIYKPEDNLGYHPQAPVTCLLGIGSLTHLELAKQAGLACPQSPKYLS